MFMKLFVPFLAAGPTLLQKAQWEGGGATFSPGWGRAAYC